MSFFYLYYGTEGVHNKRTLHEYIRFLLVTPSFYLVTPATHFIHNKRSNIYRVLLTNDSKIEIIGKFYVEKVTFSSFNVMNASIPRQIFLFRLTRGTY